MISCLTVALLAGGRSRGVSPSNPSSTCRLAQSGQYCSTEASKFNVPCSTCCSAAAVATILVIDMILNCVPAVTGWSSPAT